MPAQVNSQVVTAPMPDGEIILLHGGSRHYFSLNETASFLWRLIEKETPAHRMREALTSSYDISAEDADAAVHSLLVELETCKLITPRC